MSALADAVDIQEGELDARLDDIVKTAGQIFDVAGAGLMLVDAEAQFKLVGASNEGAQALERSQIESGRGPGIDATASGEVIAVQDLAEDPRWPDLAAAVVPLGVVSVLSAPIWVRDQAAGNLNLFDRERRTWSETDRTGLTAFAGVCGSLLRIALEADHKGRVLADMRDQLLHGKLTQREEDR